MITLAAMLLSGLGSASAPDCAASSVQIDINECAMAEYAKVDEELNCQWKVTFREVLSHSRSDAARLRQDQRRWIILRDTKCESEYPWSNGVSLDKFSNINCRMVMTRERMRVLTELPRRY